MKEILDFILIEERLDMFFLYLSFIGPAAGLLTGFFIGLIQRTMPLSTLKGFVVGLSGTLFSIMWLIYKSVIDHYGIDSVRGFLINIIIFSFCGVLIGFLFRFFGRKTPPRHLESSGDMES